MTRERAEAIALRAQGVVVDEIARRLGLSRRSALALLRRPATFPERACELCGESFTPTNGRQRRCPEHGYHATQVGGQKARECRLCGQRFFVTGRSGQRYCTPEHRRESERRRAADVETVSRWRQRVETLEAEVERARFQLGAGEAA
jgi:hypothetical protein